MTLQDVGQASELIRSKFHPSAHTVFGAVIDESLNGVFTVTIIVTGFGPDGGMEQHLGSTKSTLTWKEEEQELYKQIEKLEALSSSPLCRSPLTASTMRSRLDKAVNTRPSLNKISVRQSST